LDSITTVPIIRSYCISILCLERFEIFFGEFGPCVDLIRKYQRKFDID